jgi:FKBP-type peptidyl-prolyl cis-trans isomerase
VKHSLFLFVIAALAASACGGGNSTPTGPTPPSAPYSQTDLRVGTGAEATNGRLASMFYTLWMYDPAGTDGKGRQIQSNVGSAPFSFVVGTGNAIQGWHRGVPGMRVGGLRRLVLPPDLAYGARGSAPDIPPNATLVFDIELLAVQ